MRLKNIFTLLILFTSVFSINAQSLKKVLTRAKNELMHAYPDYHQMELDLLEQKESNPDNLDIDYLLSIVLLEQSDVEKQRAEPYVDNIRTSIVETDYLRDFDFYKGYIAHRNEEFDEAIKAFELCKSKFTDEELSGNTNLLSLTHFLILGIKQDNPNYLLPFQNFEKYIDNEIKQSQIAKYFKNNPEFVEIENVGKNINSKYDEYCPIFSVVDSTMYFTSRRPIPRHLKKDEGDELYLEHIFGSQFKDGEWSESNFEKSPLNSFTHNVSALTVENDGNDLFIFDHRHNSNGDVYYSTKKGDGKWTNPVPFSEQLNSDFVERSFTISDDKKLVFIERDNEDNTDRDLYYSENIDGVWSTPIKAGEELNTEFFEDGVFLHNNGQTLYFSSKGHNSIGGFDIFKSTKTSTGWSKPENLGYPINSVYDDVYIVVSDDGRTGYFSSNRIEGQGGMDIYKVELNPIPENQIIYCKVIDSENQSNINDAQVYLLSKGSNKKYPMNLMSDNTYQVDLPNEKNVIDYTVVAQKVGYITTKNNIVLADQETKINIGKVYLNKLKPVSQKITCSVVEESTNQKIDAENVQLLDIASGKVYPMTKEALGVYSTSVDNKKNSYKIITKKEGYVNGNKIIDVPADQEIYDAKDIQMRKIEEELVKFVFNDVYLFDVSSNHFFTKYHDRLDVLINAFGKYPNIVVQLEGHTDSDGAEDFNQKLSEDRAQAVKDYLVKQGVDPKQLVTVGYGESKPVATNETKAGKKQNRRVVLTLDY